ncbi:uroporphyrin-III C-methyltransferase / precorrin-2 dehydrogenase / sirohydrochlorin ferrochelatase [Enhydrobacter aerosaccus]|uniref:Uroporphyrin-III C-methyltransferase / precorrin-2 dehydrogenase / sirohydrochlorin ferrochelatase n=1 Tax=Enhydrobacter aerosaccus TaxID=225324 RepID=A0A1T4KGE3_9HYPH|nr:siroheme synthase CysG [Enhydrobacter aerosaccus]SJZ41484.1 uroporphyrin-III C-methyltransferase / precorrin-2 dehydrogenase / sirohydrochlorin ferrochelatase [Enhydrobacter aerosaccus]
MKHLPFFFNLVGRTVVVVGQGHAADRRAALAASAGAAVRRVEALVVDMLADVSAVFVATGDPARDAAAAQVARRARVPVNVVDRPGLSDFIMPAIVDRGDIVVAISSGGASPTLATMLRTRIETVLPERIDILANLAKAFRAQVNALIGEPGRRRAFWRRVVEGAVGRLALAGDVPAARRLMLSELDSARNDRPAIGIAHIVGAGPGDPDLLTVKAVQLLQEADAILHDDLVPPAILKRARRDADLLAVGKRKGHTGWTQRAIEAEMIRRVQAGQTVVRLKAGDPFIFGRGGEELEALRAAGLPATVVPGITAALGTAASVGIPLTHRRIASAVTFVTGHVAEGGQAPAWPALAAQGHTVAIYMGATEAAAVRDRLLEAGAPPQTAVAIVENGTRPDERISVGCLSDLPRLAAAHTPTGGAGPSLIIVGDVVSLAHIHEQPVAQVS